MELWTADHARTILPALLCMLILGAALRQLLGEKPLKIRMIPLQVLAVAILLLEIGKQSLSFARGYDLYHIPLHFCSLFIFMLPLMAFYRGKHRSKVCAITAALCASVMALMLIYPNLIYSAGNIQNYFGDFMDFHTVTFHNIVMLAFILIVALELHTPAPKGEPKAVLLFITGFCIVSATMAQLLKTNYANYYSCNVPVFEQLRLQLQGVLGVFLTQLLYVLIVSALNLMFVLGAYWLYRLLRKLSVKRAAVK